MNKEKIKQFLKSNPRVEFVGVDKDGEIIIIKYKELAL